MSKHTILYLGLDIPDYLKDQSVIHYPIIKIVPVPSDSPDIKTAFAELTQYTHIIFTSKNSVRIFVDYLLNFGWNLHHLDGKQIIAVGKVTAQCLEHAGIHVNLVSKLETAEGITHDLPQVLFGNSYVFWPHSKLSRSVIPDFLKDNQIKFRDCILYDTVSQKPLPVPDLDKIDEIIFTSPSTVDAFMKIFGSLPRHKVLTAIGPITQVYLNACHSQ